MHSKTLITNSIPTTITINNHDHENPQMLDDFDQDEIVSHDHEPEIDNNPPDSFWISHQNVTNWLNHNTFIERKTSVKMVTSSRKFESNQVRSSQRSVSFNHKPKTTIIGFRPKPGHSSDNSKSKQNDHVGLFKNRSMPGKSCGVQVSEPRSPRVSCMGRVGSMRGRVRRTGFWKKVKTAILTRVRSGDR
ncbi:hypothetical protein QVD17_07653 [Tagetes erecta]|uniref:Uncharacterized protein n=1 Tax=Tagetes erecta TaxID=13708 RepID=A0AAD8P7I1_TARER|nr:hypothetical protein QVD17_07653 [Tagetes erecta]